MPIEESIDGSEVTTVALLRSLEEARGRPCVDCGGTPCGHEIVYSIAMGYRDAIRCLPCLAAGLGRDLGDLRETGWRFLARKDCFRAGLEDSSRREGEAFDGPPGCLGGAAPVPSSDGSPPEEPADPTDTTEDPVPRLRWDAGDMSCGDLVLALRLRMKDLSEGDVIAVTATDLAAPEDLPAWCRLTGHRMVVARHPHYFIRKRNDPAR